MNLPRTSSDSFTYVIVDKKDTLIDLRNGSNQSYTGIFESSKKIAKSNFNIFDPIFAPLKLKVEENQSNFHKYTFFHPKYPKLNFYIKLTNIKNNITIPKNMTNFVLIDDVSMKKYISKLTTV